MTGVVWCLMSLVSPLLRTPCPEFSSERTWLCFCFHFSGWKLNQAWHCRCCWKIQQCPNPQPTDASGHHRFAVITSIMFAWLHADINPVEQMESPIKEKLGPCQRTVSRRHIQISWYCLSQDGISCQSEVMSQMFPYLLLTDSLIFRLPRLGLCQRPDNA